MNVYISIVSLPHGERDVEVLDAAPADTFYADLDNALAEGVITGYEVREGSVNGGDSRIVRAS